MRFALVICLFFSQLAFSTIHCNLPSEGVSIKLDTAKEHGTITFLSGVVAEVDVLKIEHKRDEALDQMGADFFSSKPYDFSSRYRAQKVQIGQVLNNYFPSRVAYFANYAEGVAESDIVGFTEFILSQPALKRNTQKGDIEIYYPMGRVVQIYVRGEDTPFITLAKISTTQTYVPCSLGSEGP